MTRKKSHDEVYCRSCGDIIKKRAEICPECGVKNHFHELSRNNSNTQTNSGVEINVGTDDVTGDKNNTTSNKHQSKTITDSVSSGIGSILNTKPNDPSEYSTNVSDNWGYGVGASLLLWITSLTFSGVVSSLSLLSLIGWMLMPTSIYFDTEYLKSTTIWKPNISIWIVLSVIPLVNIVAGGVYMFRRYNTEEISKPESNSYRGTSEDPAIQELKERYSRGEISDSEFESQLEQIIQTKDRDPKNKERVS